MPENIFKIYPPKKGPSKDGRRGSGLWSEDRPEKRLEHVKRILDLYYEDDILMDDLDLTWFLKNAVIGDIYFSKTVAEGIRSKYWKDPNSGIIKDIINRIIKGQTTKNGTFDESLLQVRKWLGKEYHEIGVSPLRFEHVIPAKIYLSELKKLYLETKCFTEANSLSRFNEFRKNVVVCIITKEEDDALNNSGLRESMPAGWEWGKDIFARYNYEKLEKKIVVERIP